MGNKTSELFLVKPILSHDDLDSDVKELISKDCNHSLIYWKKAVKITERLRSMELALKDICNIKNQTYGGDWDEIDEARRIANNALK